MTSVPITALSRLSMSVCGRMLAVDIGSVRLFKKGGGEGKEEEQNIHKKKG